MHQEEGKYNYNNIAGFGDIKNIIMNLGLTQNYSNWVSENMGLGKGIKKGHVKYKFLVFRYHNGKKWQYE